MSADDDWRRRAACGGMDAGMSEMFWAFDLMTQLVAKKFCRECPVRRECLDAGMCESDGIWGGYTPGERRGIRYRRKVLRQQREARAVAVPT